MRRRLSIALRAALVTATILSAVVCILTFCLWIRSHLEPDEVRFATASGRYWQLDNRPGTLFVSTVAGASFPATPSRAEWTLSTGLYVPLPPRAAPLNMQRLMNPVFVIWSPSFFRDYGFCIAESGTVSSVSFAPPPGGWPAPVAIMTVGTPAW